MYSVLFFILGVAITIWIYETYAEKKEKAIEKALPMKMAYLLEECTKRIIEEEKMQKSELSEDEKNKIMEECYSEI